jgi:hypothetical protein
MTIAMLGGISEGGWLVIVGFGLILCLAVFTIAVVFLANRLSGPDAPDCDGPDPDPLKRLKAIEEELKTLKTILRRHGIVPSPRENPSPPLHIKRDSA